MSVTNKVIQLLSAKYAFDINQATLYVNAAIQNEKALKQAKKAEQAAKKAEQAAKKAEKQPKKYIVTFHNNSKQMDAEDISLIQEDYKLEFVFQVEKITDVEIVPLCASNLSDYAKFVEKHADDIDDNEFDSIWFSYQTPSQMNYSFLFHGQEYQVKFHQV